MSRLVGMSALGGLIIAALIVGVMLLTASPAANAQTVTVHKTPWCGCCAAWVDHLHDEGFDVIVKEEEDLTPIRSQLGVRAELMSCHTAEVAGYVVEGHVPAREIRRLLEEKPDVDGLSIPGMPQGSPGMETPNAPDRYDVIIFSGEDARTYASYRGTQLVSEQARP